MQDPDPAGHLFGGVVTGVKQPTDAASQWLNVRFQQTRLQTGEQVLHSQQSMHFRGVEPQPGQCIAILTRSITFITVTAHLVVPEYRRRQAIAHVLKITAHRSSGHFHLVHHGPQRRSLTGTQQAINRVEALRTVQSGCPAYAFAA